MTWRSREIITPRGSNIVSAIDAARQCNLIDPDSDQQALLAAYTAAAQDHIESRTGLALGSQTVRLSASSWGDLAAIPLSPITSVAITYVDGAGAVQTLVSDKYEMIGETSLAPAIIFKPNVSPPIIYTRSDAIRIQCVCGSDTVPPAIKSAALLLIADLFEQRAETIDARYSVDTAFGVEALICNYRINA